LSGGDLTISSQSGERTTLQATFQHSYIDQAFLGDMTVVLLAVILDGSCDIRFVHRVDGRESDFDMATIRVELGGVPLTHREVRRWLQKFIAEGEASLEN
jgi:hypothetical protein